MTMWTILKIKHSEKWIASVFKMKKFILSTSEICMSLDVVLCAITLIEIGRQKKNPIIIFFLISSTQSRLLWPKLFRLIQIIFYCMLFQWENQENTFREHVKKMRVQKIEICSTNSHFIKGKTTYFNIYLINVTVFYSLFFSKLFEMPSIIAMFN